MKYWEVEFACDNTWSMSNVWSVYYAQSHKPTDIEINQILGRPGIKRVIRVLEVTKEEFYDNAIDYFKTEREVEHGAEMDTGKRAATGKGHPSIMLQ